MRNERAQQHIHAIECVYIALTVANASTAAQHCSSTATASKGQSCKALHTCCGSALDDCMNCGSGRCSARLRISSSAEYAAVCTDGARSAMCSSASHANTQPGTLCASNGATVLHAERCMALSSDHFRVFKHISSV
eukprot:922-Heterococcus_DN1.PRE.2